MPGRLTPHCPKDRSEGTPDRLDLKPSMTGREVRPDTSTPTRRYSPVYGTPSVIQAGAGSPFRWWSKNCIILIE